MTRSTTLPKLLISLALAGCAGATQARPDAQDASDASPSGVQALQRETEEQARRIAELETRLALLESEAREWRQTAGSPKPTETVRIGSRRRDADATDAPRSAVPLVRLHEREPEFGEPLPLPEPPVGVASRLDVVPLPGQRASKALDAEPASDVGDGSAQYRAGLRSLRERRWQEALDAFTDLLTQHPAHALADKATYWRGEVHYAQRRYDEALVDFQAVVSQFARSDKVADALLKLGLCHERLGDRASAARYFRQLREQYPSSDAARIASRENRS